MIIDILRKLTGGHHPSRISKLSPEEQFAEIIKAVHPVLKQAGYTKQGSKFRKLFCPNVALIQFQRSRYNDKYDIRFTINISIISAALMQYLGALEDLKKASEWHGHLRQRIGSFDPLATDKWWKLDDNSDAQSISKEVVQLVTDCAIPFISDHSTDEQLLAYWKSGKAAGTTEFQREQFVAILDK